MLKLLHKTEIMEINIHNYEAFFLDFIEGNLSASAVKKVKLFLAAHPELDAELAEFENIQLTPANIHFSEKNSLKKNTETVVSDDEYIARLEGDLTEIEAEKFDHRIVLNSNELAIYNQFKQTKLVPDPKIVFPHKNRLKKMALLYNPLVHRIIYSSLAVAAGLSILFASVIYLDQKSSTPTVFSRKSELLVYIPNVIRNAKITNAIAYSPEYQKNKLEINHQIENLKTDGSAINNPQQRSNEIFALMHGREIRIKQDTDLLALAQIQTAKTDENETIYLGEASVEKIPTLGEYLQYSIKKQILPDKDDAKKRRVKFWDIARATSKLLNKLTGTQIDISPIYDDKGQMLSLDIKSKNFGLSKKY